jgi:hypothetical protein
VSSAWGAAWARAWGNAWGLLTGAPPPEDSGGKWPTKEAEQRKTQAHWSRHWAQLAEAESLKQAALQAQAAEQERQAAEAAEAARTDALLAQLLTPAPLPSQEAHDPAPIAARSAQPGALQIVHEQIAAAQEALAVEARAQALADQKRMNRNRARVLAALLLH